VPAVAWTLFSLVYYGFPFPNTAYAKLATGIDSSELRAQGLLYLLDSLDRDPITLTTIAIAAVIAAVQRTVAARVFAAGIILYVWYIVSIGGDFMAGLNPTSKSVARAWLEPSLANAQPDDKFQFERHGYFVADLKDHAPGTPVFNRTVTLKDSWAQR